MGLDFRSKADRSYANRPSWSYGGFNRFRERLAKACGFDLMEMEGFRGSRAWADVKDALVPLLNHSDCDGKLTATQCRRVAPRLREIIASKEFSASNNDIESDYDAMMGLRLADMMDECAAGKYPLEFC